MYCIEKPAVIFYPKQTTYTKLRLAMFGLPCKIAKIMKKRGFLLSCILVGALSSVFNFLKSQFITQF